MIIKIHTPICPLLRSHNFQDPPVLYHLSDVTDMKDRFTAGVEEMKIVASQTEDRREELVVRMNNIVKTSE